ncbi:hypothetical protein [Neptuniibacter sp. UBA847]|uniref:phage tail tip fiber protein n=1 Tax=Neptuniibacter sp. UBA847 TaxID=1946977 RepID=UPI000C50F2F1|nr:hypothetical protein [Neptuniibacter sp. UBA847]MAY42273.1 hypothetical protein [Oceanospirillaceae bacterium]|tara:strand:+ start:4155 stop:5540 length:1386 start_codon:yes stop_codon:yes gene_type:complete
MKSSIPPITVKDPNERRLLTAIKEAVEVGKGIIGNPLDRNLTVRDLVDSGLATVGIVSSQKKYISGSDLNPTGSGEEQDLTAPPTPSGLTAFKGAASIFLTWDKPNFGSFAHANIYRSTTDNFSNAAVISNVLGLTHADYVPYEVIDEETGQIRGYYYWLTFVSEAGKEGPPNAASGVYQEPVQDGDEVFKRLSVNLLVGDTANFVTSNINDASITSAKIAQIIKSDNYDADNGWSINKDGTAVFNNAIIRGTAQSQGYSTATKGWQLNSDGSFTLRSDGGDIVLSTAGVPMGAITGAGSLAYLNSITSGTYIKNGILDTLHLAGQAVSIPSGKYTSGSITLSSTTKTVQSLTYTSTGAPTAVFFSLLVRSNDSDTLSPPTINVKITRDGSTKYDYTFHAYGRKTIDEGSDTWHYNYYPVSGCILDNAGSGSRTYKIEITKGGSNNKIVTKRALIALELKK